MEARTLAAALLQCGTLDIDYLIRLVDAYEMEFDDLLDEFDWLYSDEKPTLNSLILLVLDNVARQFLEKAVK